MLLLLADSRARFATTTLAQCAPMLVAMMLHSDVMDAELMERVLSDCTITGGLAAVTVPDALEAESRMGSTRLRLRVSPGRVANTITPIFADSTIGEGRV